MFNNIPITGAGGFLCSHICNYCSRCGHNITGVDTSVWITFFRGKNPQLVELITMLLKSGRPVYTGIIALELINSARGQKELQTLHDAFDAMEYIIVNETTYFSAGKLGYELSRKGHTFSTVDLLIAQTALENGLSLLTYDEHFKVIAKYSPLTLSKAI